MLVAISRATQVPIERVKGLDALRGLMALSVMIYHYASWSRALAPGILGNAFAKLGTYAVESFYVLSGFSLLLAYDAADFSKRHTHARFFWKRVMRLLPLFAVATLLSLVRDGAPPDAPWLVVAGHLTLLFGFVSPALSIVTGGWSIGLEMVFYTVFAGAMWLRTRHRAAVAGLAFASLLASLPWAFWLLTPEASLAAQWRTYVAVPNHLFLFCGGMALAEHMSRHRWLQRGGAWLLLAGGGLAAVFCAIIPVTIDEIRFVTGVQRLGLALTCMGAVCVFAHARLPDRAWTRALQRLGDLSYGVYLIHPFALWAARQVPIFPGPQFGLAAALTIFGANVIYDCFELRFMRIAPPFGRDQSSDARSKLAA